MEVVPLASKALKSPHPYDPSYEGRPGAFVSVPQYWQSTTISSFVIRLVPKLPELGQQYVPISTISSQDYS